MAEEKKNIQSTPQNKNFNVMSEKEAKKWFKRLDRKKGTHIYQITPKQEQKDDSNPW